MRGSPLHRLNDGANDTPDSPNKTRLSGGLVYFFAVKEGGESFGARKELVLLQNPHP